jgi:thioredoxin-dependent peroxiredoxin
MFIKETEFCTMKLIGFISLAIVLVVWVGFIAWPSVLTALHMGGYSDNKTGHEASSIGTKLPAVQVPATAVEGNTINLAEWQKNYTVLIFYPMDQTPGCTIQLCAMRDAYPNFTKNSINVAGVNPGNLKSHQTFADKQKLPFPLIVDEGRVLAKQLGVKPTMGTVSRTVVVVSPDQGVIWVKEGMPSPKDILAQITNHQAHAVSVEQEGL